MKRVLLAVLILILALPVLAQDPPPPLQVNWEYSSYYALPNEYIHLNSIVRNTGDVAIENIVLTLNLPEGVTLQYEDLFATSVPIESLDAGQTHRLTWPVIAAEAGVYTIQADIEAGDLFYASLTDLTVGQRAPALGYYSQGVFNFIDGLGQGEVLSQVRFGEVNARPLVGDWDGDGYTGFGVYQDNQFFLRNTTVASEDGDVAPEIVLSFTDLEDPVPLVGDWDGSGQDSVMLYKDGVFYLRYAISPGDPDVIFEYGPRDQLDLVPLTGDWNGDGVDTVGVYFGGVFYLRDENMSGNADIVFAYGPEEGARPIVGDWNGDGIDTIGVIIGQRLHLRDELSSGDADAIIDLSSEYFLPVAFVGYWLGAD